MSPGRDISPVRFPPSPRSTRSSTKFKDVDSERSVTLLNDNSTSRDGTRSTGNNSNASTSRDDNNYTTSSLRRSDRNDSSGRSERKKRKLSPEIPTTTHSHRTRQNNGNLPVNQIVCDFVASQRTKGSNFKNLIELTNSDGNKNKSIQYNNNRNGPQESSAFQRRGSEVASELWAMKPYSAPYPALLPSSSCSSSSSATTASSSSNKALVAVNSALARRPSSKERPKDARALIEARRNPKRYEPEVEEEVIEDYSRPRAVREMQMSRQIRENGIVDTIKESAYLAHHRIKVRGDADDADRFKRYLQVGKTMTSDDFGGCQCGRKGKQIWIRLCGCGCKCSRCKPCVRYTNNNDEEPEGF